ncbi:ABC transporter permease [Frondihabitans sucicola]|uniref:ABC transporter permease n=1 Tax=Frondihabitans sucicola TaxID=1268041 RepID=A0ABN6XXW6_9MICO|nr:ABC transporter permease [Frondihabitans sucicola]BDZ49819.1 ABC transporter permease [Frondihabitans sucicola]
MPSSPSQLSADHFVADLEETPIRAVDAVDESEKPRSSWTDAWESMRSRPLFWISGVLILLIIAVAIFPGVFNHVSATSANLNNSNGSPRAGHIMGFTYQGQDVYARLIVGARASLTVGILATLICTVIGIIIGALAGYYGGWLDAVVSRIGDIFFSIPTVLGAIVIMTTIPNRTPLTVAVILAIFAWPQVARQMRGAVISAAATDYVMASTALGVSRFRILIRHVVPNAINPVIVIATVSLGTFIVAESTLSFLGIGLPGTTISWGNDISSAQTYLRTAPLPLLWPAVALSITVLSFLMMGDVVRDALDPKARARR